jgi:hypothetical protein
MMKTCINCHAALDPKKDAGCNVCLPCWKSYRQWRRSRGAEQPAVPDDAPSAAHDTILMSRETAKKVWLLVNQLLQGGHVPYDEHEGSLYSELLFVQLQLNAGLSVGTTDLPEVSVEGKGGSG